MRERAILLVAVAVLLAPWGEVGWVWDDALLIAENENLGWSRILTMWGEDLWAGVPGERTSLFYRPLMVATLVFDHNVLGGSPLLSRLHSLAWHLLCVGLLHRLLRGRPAALAATALYALHPVATELVHFVAARNDTMAIAAILGLLLVFEPREVGARRRLLGAAVLFAGLLAKESAVLALVVLPLYDWSRFGGLRPRRYLEVGVGALAALLLRALVSLDSPGLGLEPMLMLTIAAEYGMALLNPLASSPATAPSELVDLDLIGLVFLGLLVFLARARAWTLALTIGGLALAVVGASLSDGLAWRYLALPLLGICCGIGHWETRRPWVGWLVLAVVGLVTLVVKPMWTDSVAFWTSAHAREPQAATACGLFKTLELSGDDAGAAEVLPEAIPRPHCCYNASRFWLDRGDPETALSFGEEALARGCPQSSELLAPMGLSAALSGDWDRALRYATYDEGRDPYGYSKVVLTAEGLRRDDRTALEHFGGDPGLEERALQLISQSSR